MKPRRRKLPGTESRRWLARAARWRLLSLLFQPPTRASRRELSRLAETAPEDEAALSQEWASVPIGQAVAEFHRVLGPGRVPAVESSYDPNALAGRGPLLADIAGFHKAFAYRPEQPPAEVPDHIAVLLDFLSYLAFKAAFAVHEKKQEEAYITAVAYERFLEAHLHHWVAAFRERLECSGSVFYIRAARMIPVPAKKQKPRAGALPILALVLLAVCLAAPAAAQSPSAIPPERAEAAQEQPAKVTPPPSPTSKPLKIGEVTFSGSLRGRLESWGWFAAPQAEDAYSFGAFNLRLALEQKRERVEWKLEGLFPWLLGLPTNAILPPPQGQLGLGATYFAASGRQDGSAVLRQGYVRFKRLFGDAGSSLRLGRFEFAEGAEVAPADAALATLKRDRIAQRLIGSFGFSHVGRGFDGVHYVRSTPRDNFTLLATRPTEGVFQLRSLKQLNVDFYYAAWTRQLPGKSARAETRLFALHYHDGRRTLKTDNRPQAARAADSRNIRLTTLGGHALSVFNAGRGKVDLLLWGAGQFGRWGALSHRAAGVAIEAGYQFDARGSPWLRGGYFRSTGDSDPNDGRHSTFFQVLPTPRIYARFPFYNLMNLEDVFGELRIRPLEKLTLRGDVRHLRLSSRQDLWYAGGGAFQEQTFGYLGRPANSQAGLGTLFDFSLDFAATPTTTLTFYAGGVRGGAVQAAIYPAGGNSPAARFLYLELIQRF
jgi:TorA maturation chaperone TorD